MLSCDRPPTEVRLKPDATRIVPDATTVGRRSGGARWLARFVVLAFITAAFTELALRAQEPFFHLMMRRFDWASRFIGDPIWNHWPRPSRTSTHAMVDPAAYPRPFTYRTNSLGLRDDRELTIPKPRGVVRVLMLGDSYTEGYYAEDTVSARLEARLTNLFPDVKHEVINGGCSSYSPLLEYLRLKHQLVQLEPDLVVVNVDPSDIFDDAERYGATAVFDATGEPLAAGGYVNRFRRGAEWIKDWSYLARVASWYWRTRHADKGSAEMTYVPYHSSIPPESAQWQKEVAATMANLRRIIEYCRNRRIRIAVTTYPHRRHLAPNPGEALWHRGYERRIQELCDKEHVPFHSAYDDIAAAYRVGQPLYWESDVHFTPVGQRVWSESIIRFYLTRLHPAREGR